jgi:hypothetical protein
VAEGLGVEIKGGPELRRALHQLDVDLKDLSKLHREIARIVAAAARAEAPIESGQLEASLRPSGTQRAARVVSRLIYAPVIHYGWPAHNIEANRFGDRALARTSTPVLARYREGIDQLLRKAEH